MTSSKSTEQWRSNLGSQEMMVQDGWYGSESQGNVGTMSLNAQHKWSSALPHKQEDCEEHAMGRCDRWDSRHIRVSWLWLLWPAVSYKESTRLGVTTIGRRLSIAHLVGGIMSYWVLTQTGTVISRITVQFSRQLPLGVISWPTHYIWFVRNSHFLSWKVTRYFMETLIQWLEVGWWYDIAGFFKACRVA